MGSSKLEAAGASEPTRRPAGLAARPGRLARIVGAAVAGALTVVTVGLVLALWGLGLTGKISQSTSEVLDLVKLGFALVAGVGGTVGLVLAYQRHLIAVEAGERERAKEGREDAKEERENTKLFNERFERAAAQLGAEQYAVKLAGVYAMAKLADDWDEGRQTCVNVLCANLRRDWVPVPAYNDDPAQILSFTDTRTFRRTIIDVIASRLRKVTDPWQGCYFDFRRAHFEGGDFTRVKISDGVLDFRGAVFSNLALGFLDATFSGGVVDFSGATFSGGTLTFKGSKFCGGLVDFSRVKFSGGSVDLREPRDWSVPPVLPEGPDAAVQGFKLPAAALPEQGGTPSSVPSPSD